MIGKSLLIVGSGGQGKVALDCASTTGEYDDIAFFTNDTESPHSIGGYEVIQEGIRSASDVASRFDEVFIAVGDNRPREQLTQSYKAFGAKIATLVHPRSCISPFARIGAGSIVMPNAVINAFASVGIGCIVNTSAVVEHDCEVGSFVHLSPCACMGGGTTIGDRSWLCLGSCVRDHVRIGSDIVLGANSCAIDDLEESGTYIGSPARLIQQD